MGLLLEPVRRVSQTPWNAGLLKASLWMTICLSEEQGFTCSYPQLLFASGVLEMGIDSEINRQLAVAVELASHRLLPRLP